jgi:hypothetical protein
MPSRCTLPGANTSDGTGICATVGMVTPARRAASVASHDDTAVTRALRFRTRRMSRRGSAVRAKRTSLP